MGYPNALSHGGWSWTTPDRFEPEPRPRDLGRPGWPGRRTPCLGHV